MKCQHCGHDFESKTLDAQQGSSIPCPECRQMSSAHYTIQDELADPLGVFVFRDTKYARPVIVMIGLIVLGPFILFGTIYCLKQTDMPEAKAIAVVALIAFAFTVAQFIRRMRKSRKTSNSTPFTPPETD